ncbi:MAG: RluA family pseudouridine synthase [Treponema sp.]
MRAMTFSDFTAGADDDGRRLDKIVRRFIPEQNLSRLYGAIRKGLIKMNGKKAAPDHRVNAGDTLNIADVLLERRTAPAARQIAHFPFPYEIVFQNRHALIINKPYGVSVHGGEEALDNAVRRLYAAEYGKNASLSFTPGLVHRLDRRTTGLLVFSQSIDGARFLSEAFAAGTVKKTYLAIVCGKMTAGALWDDAILNDGKAARGFKTVKVVPHGTAGAQNARTRARPLEYGTYNGSPCALALFHIDTGRKHQIRAQSAYHGFPLLGDGAYCADCIKAECAHFLHSYSLAFPQNNLGLPEKLTAPLPAAFQVMLDRLGMRENLPLG